MGRSTKISYEVVAAAADKLKHKGIPVTNSAVRNEIGSGSLGTVGVHMKVYRDSENRPSNTSINDTISPEITRVISDCIATKVQESISALTNSQTNLQGEFDDLLMECNRQSTELESLEESRSALASEYAVLKGRAGQFESEVVSLKVELAKEKNISEEMRIELAKSILKLEYVPLIKDELEQVRTEFENYRAQSVAELKLAVAESASLHEVAAVATAKLQGEITLRASFSDSLKEVARQRDQAYEETKRYASEAAELRGKLQLIDESLVRLNID